MKQSRLMSLIESVVSIIVGFGISVAAQAFFLPLFGVSITWQANLSFAAVMTVISIGRQFIMRRIFEALHIRRPLSAFMQAAIAERFRQVEQEGWSLQHDDEHKTGELAQAGAMYAQYAGSTDNWLGAPSGWPWSPDWWKPAGYRRDLVRAAALIIAEGEKFDRNRRAR